MRMRNLFKKTSFLLGFAVFLLFALGAVPFVAAQSITFDKNLDLQGTKSILNASSIGIGTVSPGYTFTVEKTATSNWVSRIYNTGTGVADGGLLVRAGDSADATAGAFGVMSTGAYRFYVRGDGNVGIGTTSPGATLDVQGRLRVGAASVYGPLNLKQDNIQNYGGIWLEAQNVQDAVAIGHTGSIGYVTTEYTGTGGTTPLELRTWNGASFIRLNTDGNVGIGTAAPSYKLDVNGTGQFNQPVIVGTPTASTHAATKSYVDSMFTGSGPWTLVSLSNTGGSAQWVKLGTLTISQGGKSAFVKIISNNGYNATISQNFEIYVRFKTSNGSSVDGNGFAGDSSYYVMGENATLGPNIIKWKANAAGVSATTYDLYVNFGTFTGEGSFYTVETSGGSWVHSGVGGQTDPGSGSTTVLIATKEFNVGGSSLVVNSSGNVGIGTTGPSDLLHVVGNNDNNGNYYSQIRVDGTGAYPLNMAGISLNPNAAIQSHIRFLENGTPKFQIRFNNGNSSDNKLKFYSFTTATDMVTFDAATGNVGIGTTAPNSKLEVTGGPAMTSGWNRTMMLTDSYPGIVFNSTAGPKFAGINYDATSNLNIRVGATSNDIYASGVNAISINATNGNTAIGGSALYVQNNGNVGIGTTSPDGTAKVTVVNGDNSMTLYGPNASWGSYLWVGAGSAKIAVSQAQVISTNGNLHLDSGTGNAIYIQYYSSRDTFINPNSGNVGIGNQGPAYKLDVVGTSQFSQPVIVGTPTANSHAATKSYVDSASISKGSNQASVSTNWGYYVNTNMPATGASLVSVYVTGNNSTWKGVFLVQGENSYTPTELWNNAKLISWAGYNASADDVQAWIMSNTAATGYGGITLVIKTNAIAAGGAATMNVTVSGTYANQLNLVSSAASPFTYTMTTSANTYQIYQMTSGNVGIGTAAPLQKLDVLGTLSQRSSITGNYTNVSGWTGNAGGFHDVYYDGSVQVHLSAGPASGPSYINNGNVGIGTTNPDAYLAGVPGLAIYSGSYAGMSLNNSGKSWLQWVTGNDLRFYEGGAGLDRVTFQAGGNVGIGTTNPGFKLDIQGTLPAQALRLQMNGETDVQYVDTTDLQSWESGTNGNGYYIYDDNGGGYTITAKKGTGYVGIGTTAPSYKLDVNGYGQFAQPVIVGTPTAASHAATKNYVDSIVLSPSALVVKGNCSGNPVNIDWSAGKTQHCVLTGNVTFTFSNGQSGGAYKLILKQDGVGSHTVTWPTVANGCLMSSNACIRWGTLSEPYLTPTPNKTDYVGFIYNGVGDGTNGAYDGVAFNANY